jgi:tetratricopeptide (TPR) repeat protein
MRRQGYVVLLIAVLASSGCARYQPVQVGVARGESLYSAAPTTSLPANIHTVLKISQENTVAQTNQAAQLLSQKPELAALAENTRLNSNDLESRHTLAEAYLGEKLLTAAFGLYQEILVVSPGNARAELGLARIWNEWGDYEQAREYAERAVDGASSNPDAFELLGRICLHQKNTESAVRAFEAALRITPASPSILANAGYAYLLRSEWVEARDHLERALKLDESIAEAHNHLGIVFAHLGERDAALNEFTAVNSLAASLNNLGAVYLAENRLPEAYTEFLKALSVDPGHEKAMANLRTIESLLPVPVEVVIKSVSTESSAKGVQSSSLNTASVHEVGAGDATTHETELEEVFTSQPSSSPTGINSGSAVAQSSKLPADALASAYKPHSPSAYVIQVYAGRDKGSARSLGERLVSASLTPEISSIELAEKEIWYRVRLHGYESLQIAQKAARNMVSSGLIKDFWIMREDTEV